ncbi:MAG: cytochrome c oxidase subunit VIa family protein [Asgard group archaeon]|nr:cytochrome c oxidase subunit VIa family protein [Asgard group archaeon]
MFRKGFQQLAFRRFNSHAHHLKPSAFLKEAAYKPNKAAGEEFIKKYEEKVHHSGDITKLWRKLTYLVAIPAVLLVAIPVGKVELEHAEHRKHQAHMTDDEWPTQYDYQNIRLKPFFWGDGDKTLFWNSDVNRHVVKD